MDSNPAHSVRNSLRDKETAFRLGDNALNWDNGRDQGSIPYQDIEHLNLITYGADAADPDAIHGQMIIRTKAGKTVKLRSHHMKGLGSFENRSATYVPFVRELCRRAAAANPDTYFVSGSSGLRTVWLVIAILVGVVSLALGLVLLAEGFRAGMLAGSLLSAYLSWTSFKRFRAYRANTFDPANPPDELFDL